ncbi:unnamed protein product, partial [Polarella glacialis]
RMRKRRTKIFPTKDEEHDKKQAAFAGADKLKQQAKEASMRPAYNVFDYYYETGCFQHIAKSMIFDSLTLLVVCLNAIWIAIDTDMNK